MATPHLHLSRRHFMRASAASIASLGIRPVGGLAAHASSTATTDRAVIYIFLSGGLAQQDTFDLKPDAPENIRGEFDPIATRTPGVQICEHLPQLATRSHLWSLVRSMTHPYNEHSQGHMVMLSGRTELPRGFNPGKPQPTDHPSMAAIVGSLLPDQGGLPSAMVLPERLVHRTGRVIPGQFAGVMGNHREPYFLEASRYNAQTYGAWPEFGFHHQRGKENPPGFQYQTPSLNRPPEVSEAAFLERVRLLARLEASPHAAGPAVAPEAFDQFRQRALHLLGDAQMQQFFDVTSADRAELDRYGRNTFGWSLLMARRLVEHGVRFVQVNLGNNETWDTHGNAFPHLKNYLLPPLDRSVSALLDDLNSTGRLDSTLLVMAGEFGRTPKISKLSVYDKSGRDHWGAVQTVWLAGGGIRGGRVVGASDAHGGQPVSEPQHAENLAATIYEGLGISRDAAWHDLLDRPMPLYLAEPIRGLS